MEKISHLCIFLEKLFILWEILVLSSIHNRNAFLHEIFSCTEKFFGEISGKLRANI